jgi:hypothetical protein
MAHLPPRRARDRLKTLALSLDTLPNADEIVTILSSARS